jgi:hypothetical protein
MRMSTWLLAGSRVVEDWSSNLPGAVSTAARIDVLRAAARVAIAPLAAIDDVVSIQVTSGASEFFL